MSSFQDILKLCHDDGGKVFIMDSRGEVVLVILAATEYKRIKDGGVSKQAGEDVEAINRAITQAQLSEGLEVNAGTSGRARDPVAIKSVLKNWHSQRPKLEEVIDPSWDQDGAFSV